MAPEVLKGGDADARSDLFSFGAVLYEMLTGEAPFKGTGNARIIAAILTEEPPPLLQLRCDTPPPLEWIVRTCLAKDPDERFQDAREVVRQLRLLEQTQPSPATPTPIQLSPPPRPRRVAVLAFAIGGGHDWRHRGNGDRPAEFGDRRARTRRSFGGATRRGVAVPPDRRGVGRRSRAMRRLAATLTAMLAKLTTKHVLQVSSTSEVHSRGIASATDARRQLGATLALEGSLMRAANGVRVTYALVDTATARQIDALTLDGGAVDAFRIQDALANWAVGVLRLTLDATERLSERRATQSTDAYAFALQARGYLVDYQRPGALDIAISLFKRALAADSRYAVAHGGLGEAYWRKYEATKETGLVEDARASCRRR